VQKKRVCQQRQFWQFQKYYINIWHLTPHVFRLSQWHHSLFQNLVNQQKGTKRKRSISLVDIIFCKTFLYETYLGFLELKKKSLRKRKCSWIIKEDFLFVMSVENGRRYDHVLVYLGSQRFQLIFCQTINK